MWLHRGEVSSVTSLLCPTKDHWESEQPCSIYPSAGSALWSDLVRSQGEWLYFCKTNKSNGFTLVQGHPHGGRINWYQSFLSVALSWSPQHLHHQTMCSGQSSGGWSAGPGQAADSCQLLPCVSSGPQAVPAPSRTHPVFHLGEVLPLPGGHPAGSLTQTILGAYAVGPDPHLIVVLNAQGQEAAHSQSRLEQGEKDMKLRLSLLPRPYTTHCWKLLYCKHLLLVLWEKQYCTEPWLPVLLWGGFLGKGPL